MNRLATRFLRIVLAAAALGGTAAAAMAQDTVVVPNRVIYPGEAITADLLVEVPSGLTSPPSEAIAVVHADADGKVAKRTLLPGRFIGLAALRDAYAVEAGKPVVVNFSAGSMVISLKAVPLQAGAVGDMIRLRNMDSGTVFSGVVLANGTVAVGAS